MSKKKKLDHHLERDPEAAQQISMKYCPCYDLIGKQIALLVHFLIAKKQPK